MRAYRSRAGKNPETGKWPLASSPKDGFEDLPVIRPCGKCIGCRLDRTRNNAIRAMHESEMHDRSSFLTLTYDDANLPYNEGSIYPTLLKRDLTLFIKRLRKYLEPNKIRKYGCGEYGDATQRPHYHLLLFGEDFAFDRELFSPGRDPLYTSATLTDLWGHGHAVIGDISFDSAAYVAGYCLKKFNGQMAVQEYDDLMRDPPFVVYPINPGLGGDWFDQFSGDIYNHDSVNFKGHKCKPPRYYDQLFERQGGDLASVLRRRAVIAERRLNNNIVASGATKEIVANAKMSKKSQKL